MKLKINIFLNRLGSKVSVKLVIFFSLMVLLGLLGGLDLQAKSLSLYLPSENSFDSWRSSPFTAKLMCPPITEFNLTSKKSNSVAIKSIQTVKSKDSVKWVISLNPNLYFWSSTEPVSSKELVDFFSSNLKKIVEDKNPTLKVPRYKVQVVNDKSIEILWNEAPGFGPFVLNNVPIEKDGQCASFVSPQQKKDDKGLDFLELSLRDDSSNGTIRLYTKDPGIDDNLISIKFAGDYPANPKLRLSDESIKCGHELELPIFTVIVWNSYDKNISQKLRQAITSILPRGELLRSGAGSLGSLISFPILKDHPGYSMGVKLRPYSLDKGESLLEELGFKRKDSSSWRSLDGKQFSLKFLYDNTSELLLKIMKDSLTFMGIDSSFEKGSSKKNLKDFSGYIGTFYLDEDYDYINYFHSKSRDPIFKIVNKDDSSLDKLLQDYSLSLTREKPDFTYLASIHKYMSDKELLSSIIQTNACLENHSNIKLEKKIKLDSKFFLNIFQQLK